MRDGLWRMGSGEKTAVCLIECFFFVLECGQKRFKRVILAWFVKEVSLFDLKFTGCRNCCLF